jgi:hypothetical protein
MTTISATQISYAAAKIAELATLFLPEESAAGPAGRR